MAGDGGMGYGGWSARARHKTGLRRDTAKGQSTRRRGRDGYLLARFTGEETGWGACGCEEEGTRQGTAVQTLDAGRSASGRLAIDLRVLRAPSRYACTVGICVYYSEMEGTLLWRRRATGWLMMCEVVLGACVFFPFDARVTW